MGHVTQRRAPISLSCLPPSKIPIQMRLFFSTFDVTRQTFIQNGSSFGIVNLKPIVPGRMELPRPLVYRACLLIIFFCVFLDVLVVPNRVVPRLSDLNSQEIADLFCTVQQVGNVVQKEYKAEAVTVACQVNVTSKVISAFNIKPVCLRMAQRRVNLFLMFMSMFSLAASPTLVGKTTKCILSLRTQRVDYLSS